MRCATLLTGLVLVVLVTVPAATASHGGGEEPPTCDLDTGLVIDRSGSMTGARIAAARSGSSFFVNSLSSGMDNSGLVSFNAGATVDQPLSPNHAATDAAINALVASGGTDIGAGIVASHNDFLANGRSDVRWIMVVLSDGDGGDPISAANNAKADGIEIFSIAVQGSVPATMLAIASDPKADHFYVANTPAEVEDAFKDITAYVHQLCADFTWDEACDGEPLLFADDSRVRPPASIVRATWDFGDGSTFVDDPYTGMASHAYADAGLFDVKVEVLDSNGDTAHRVHEVRVQGCPVADFECTTIRDPYLRVAFEDRSTDPDDNIVDRQWQLGDGSTASGSAFDHDYAAKGWYNVTLRVVDEDGNEDETSKPCFADLNLPPVIDPEPLHVVWEGQTVAFKVTGRDPDGDPTWYTWDRFGLPPDAHFDPDTQVFTWETRKGDAGEYLGFGFQIHDFEFMDAMTTGIIVLEGPVAPAPVQYDADDDGAPDQHDNCPYIPNRDQADRNGNGVGDVCEGLQVPAEAVTEKDEGDGPPGAPEGAKARDTDRDGVGDALDNCPFVPNPLQEDLDRDGTGDACDPDLDGDGVPQLDGRGRLLDNCPYTPNAGQADRVGDGVGDACRGDRDADGVPDDQDPCPWSHGASCGDVRPGEGLGQERGAGLQEEAVTAKQVPWPLWGVLALLALTLRRRPATPTAASAPKSLK